MLYSQVGKYARRQVNGCKKGRIKEYAAHSPSARYKLQ
jgi:hypothetical protein